MIRNIVAGIIAGANMIDRSTAVKETWGSFFERFFFLGYTPNDKLPITPLPIQSEHKEDWASVMFKQTLGFKKMYETCPNAEWYFSGDDDTYIHPVNLSAALKEFDHRKSYLVGGHCGIISCVRFLAHSNPVRSWSLWNTFFPYLRFPSGGAGFAMSHELLKNLYPYLATFPDEWVEIWKKDSHLKWAVEVCITAAAFKFLRVKVTPVKGFYGQHWVRYVSPGDMTNPQIITPEHHERFKKIIGDHAARWTLVEEPISFHHLPPDDLRDLHQRALRGAFPFTRCKLIEPEYAN